MTFFESLVLKNIQRDEIAKIDINKYPYLKIHSCSLLLISRISVFCFCLSLANFISLFFNKSNLTNHLILLILILMIFILPLLTSTNQLAFAQNNQEIVIWGANSSFAPLTNTEANQVIVNVGYKTEHEEIENELINAVMTVYAPNGSLIRTTSIPNGFTAQSDGVLVLKTTFRDKSMHSVLANITFLDVTKNTPLSNVISIRIDLEETPTSPSSFSGNASLVGTSQPVNGIEDFNFAAVGDFGCTSNTDDTVDNIIDKNPELVFALGDYSYEPTGTCWFDRIEPIDDIMRISIGNHEDDDIDDGFDGYMDHFGLSQTYYSFNHGNTHILVLDTDRNSYLSGSAQYHFALNDLQNASQDPNIDWIIVYFHRPIYTSTSSSAPSSSFRGPYHPLFDQFEVDLVLAGHNHNYQRTYPLNYNLNNSSNPIVTSTNQSEYKNPQGAIFTIVGTGGLNLHSLLDKAPFVVEQHDDYFGQLDIKITDNGNRLEGKFYRNGDNKVLDRFSISKPIGTT